MGFKQKMRVSPVTLLLPILFLKLAITRPDVAATTSSELQFCIEYKQCKSMQHKSFCFPRLEDCRQVVQYQLDFNVSMTCVNQLCDTCMLNSTSQNCSVCCTSKDQSRLKNNMMSSRSFGNVSRQSCLQQVQPRTDDGEACLDILNEYGEGGRCEALEQIISEQLRCGMAFSRCLVDSCVDEFFDSCDNGSCKEFLFFNDTFCLSPQHQMVCGEFCRFGGPELTEYEPQLTEICVAFLQSHPRPSDEDEEFLFTSSLRHFTPKLHVDTIASGIRDVVRSARRRRGRFSDETSLNILETLDMVFDDSFAPRWQNRTFATTMEMVSDVNDTLLLITEGVANDTDDNSTFTYRGSNVGFDVIKFRRGEAASNFTFPSEAQSQNFSLLDEVMVTIPFNSPCYDGDDDDDCFVAIGISVIDNFAEYITESISEESMENNTLREPDSALVSVVVQNTSNFFTEFVNEPVIFQFIPQGNVSFTGNFTYECNFLDALNSSLSWSTLGLTTRNFDGQLEVTSQHLTSFAILATFYTPGGSEGVALRVVSYIGCAISIVCLSLTIASLLLFRKKLKKGVLLYVHLNLAISLLFAMVLFIAGVDYASPYKALCITVAAVLQYLFLCAFMWMLGEGVMLYLLIVKVFGQAGRRWYILLPICWGIPVPVVAIAAGILHNDYISHNTALGTTYCWINASPTKAAIWTFLVPLIIIICVNASILLITVISIVRTRKQGSAYHKKGSSSMQLAKTAVKGSLVLLPLLGLTWVFGLFAVNGNTSMFSWLFTITNSLQGLFIFLIHVARNDYFRCMLRDSINKLLWRRKHRKASTVSVSGTKLTDLNGRFSETSITDTLPEKHSSLIRLASDEREPGDIS